MLEADIARHKEYLEALEGRVGRPMAMLLRTCGELTWLMGKGCHTFATSEDHFVQMEMYYRIAAGCLDGMLVSVGPSLLGRPMDDDMRDMFLREVKLIIDRMDGGTEGAVILMPKMAGYGPERE